MKRCAGAGGRRIDGGNVKRGKRCGSFLCWLVLSCLAVSACSRGHDIRQTIQQTELGQQTQESKSAAASDETALHPVGSREDAYFLPEEQTPLSVPQFTAEEFPVIDGSTATLPISQALYQLCTGASAKEAARRVVHNKTSQSYRNLAEASEEERQESHSFAPRLVIAYEPSDAVYAELRAGGNPLLMKPIGRDALVFLCNSKNPVRSLTEAQLADIYAGVLTNWKEVGGADAPIKAFQRPAGSGSQTLMEKLVMKGRAMGAAPAAYVISEMGELLDKVAAYDNSGNALGYSVYYYARTMYQRPNLRFLEVGGVMPSNETIRDASYPYGNAFYAVIRKDEPTDSPARQLFDWLTTDDGQALLNGLGYVGERDSRRKLPDWLKAAGKSEAVSKALPIAADEVLLADGDLLYGEAGLAVLDAEGKLLRFLPGLRLPEAAEPVLQQKRGEPLILQDGAVSAGEPVHAFHYGLYSLAENRWIVEPKYGHIVRTSDGFACFSVEEDSTGIAAYDEAKGRRYALLDAWGKALAVTEAEARQRYEEAAGYMAFGTEEFVKVHPEVLRENGAAADRLYFDYPHAGGECFAYMDLPTQLVYYDLSGKRLFAYDKVVENARIYACRARRISQRTYALHVWQESGDVFAVYQDGKLKKQFDGSSAMDTAENLDSVIVGDDFYAVSAGNYIYFYNDEDELCWALLSGWSRTD